MKLNKCKKIVFVSICSICNMLFSNKVDKCCNFDFLVNVGFKCEGLWKVGRYRKSK